MADDIRLFTSLPGHPKLRKLERRLGIHEARSVLAFLWLRVRADRPDGVLHGWSSEEVAVACDWQGDAEKLVEDLVACRWLDRSADGALSIHGWRRRQGYAVGSRSREAINRTNAVKRWLYRAGFSKAKVKDMTPEEIEAAWIDLGRPAVDANGCESQCEQDANGCDGIDSHAVRFAPSPTPSPIPSPTPSPIPSPIPIRHAPAPPTPGDTPDPPSGAASNERPLNTQALSDLEEDTRDLIDAFLAVAKRKGSPWEPPKVSTDGIPRATETRLVERALLDPAVRKDWRAVLADLDRLGLPDWWTSSKFGLGAFLKPGNFERFGTGEWAGSTPEGADTSLPPRPKYIEDLERERREQDLESERLRAERKRAREAEAAQEGGGT